MKRTRYTMPARSRGGLHMRRRLAVPVGEDARRRVFAHDTAPDAETPVRKRPATRPDGFHCDLRVAYTPHVVGPVPAGTHIASDDAPPLHATTRTDEAGKAVIEATGSDDSDGAAWRS